MLGETLTVKSLMSTHVVSISMDETLQAARQVFNRCGFHHLIVMERNQPVGVLSDRDLLKNISPFVGAPLSERPQDVATLRKRIHQIMTRQLVAINPDSSASDAARIMIEHRVSCLPVIDAEQRLVGIITLRDLVQWMVEHTLAPPDVKGAGSLYA